MTTQPSRIQYRGICVHQYTCIAKFGRASARSSGVGRALSITSAASRTKGTDSTVLHNVRNIIITDSAVLEYNIRTAASRFGDVRSVTSADCNRPFDIEISASGSSRVINHRDYQSRKQNCGNIYRRISSGACRITAYTTGNDEILNMSNSKQMSESELVRKRASLKAKATAFRKYLDQCNKAEESTSNELRTRIARMQEDLKSFDLIQDALEVIAGPEVFETRLQERTQFEDAYFKAIAEAQTIIDNAARKVEETSGKGQPVASVTESTDELHVKLPTMHLPKFYGSYEAWPGFSDTFKSAVHDNKHFRDAQKLMYLRSCLTGKAAEKIESLETTAANYSVAWNILEKCYDNPTAIINNRVKALFELPLVTRTQQNSLRELLDTANKHYRALEALDKPFLEAFPVYAIVSKLDEQTRIKWKEHTQGKTFPTVKELLEFLHDRCQLLEESQQEICRKSYQPIQRTSAPQNQYNHSKSSLAYPSSVTSPCICNLCKGGHYSQYCPKLVNINVEQRIELVRKAGLCYNCLRSNHATKNCKATTCKKCKGKHHTILHIDNQESNQPSLSPTTTLSSMNSPSEVLLSTALIHIADEHGTLHTCRVLLDSGSQSHFLTDNLVAKLGLRRDPINIPVTGINQIVSTIKTSVSTTIQSRMNIFTAKLNFLVVPRISGSIPNQAIHAAELAIPANIRLADPNFHKPSRIDGLIGAELFYKLLAIGQITLNNTSVILQKTRLGWVVSGNLPTTNKLNSRVCNLALDSLHNQIAKFWEVEDSPERSPLSKEESECEKRYQETSTRNTQTGRYTVRLPFKEGTTRLGESYNVAVKRFYSLERSFNRNPQLASQYTEFLREYESLGHMTVTQSSATDSGYYLPHHGVIKGNSLTTKLRVVFDASCKTSTGISLNETLMTGPTIQDDLFSLLIRFRSHVYVLTADIAKMYRQIEIHPDDRKYQQILWRETSDQPIKTYKLNTVTYGTSCAPFLAIRTLHQLARDEAANHPIASEILRTDFYVDDLLTGARTYEDAIKIREEITTLCQKGGFQLRQWASNVPELIDGQQDKCEEAHLNLDLDETVNALGIQWNAREDSISYANREFTFTKRITKRTILSQVAQLFDPLGLLAPIIIRAKILMQELWANKLEWDESVPIELHTKWINYCQDLTYVKRINIARKVVINNYTSLQLHGFCDASERAYGACIYIRARNCRDIQTQLLCAKSRVAPLKTLTLPRLELCAAHLMTKLFNNVLNSLRHLQFNEIKFWTDSTIVLNWINSSPHALKTFVSHRVAEIQSITSKYEWRHVPSGDNPADKVSRGLTTAEYIGDRLWQFGPTWLSSEESQWPTTKLTATEIPEMRPLKAFVTQQTECETLQRFSSFLKLQRVVAYCLRFRTNSSRKERVTIGLTTDEINKAVLRIIKLTQQEGFGKEIHSITKQNDSSSALSPLNPFIDKDGLLRVGGRLAHSKLTYSEKHPLLLPKGHHVTNLIIRHHHLQNFHSGIQATLHSIRQRYWIPSGRNSVKHIIHACVTCRRAKPTTIDYLMGDLPKDRVNCTRPFLHSGVDFCGPIFIKEKIKRNRGKVKVYLAIFVCFATKAVHIEIVSDLTTEAFLAALRRFFARRGKSAHIYSDNATNFVGARRELQELYAFVRSQSINNSIANTLANESIQWHVIPPRSPHFGGLWEAAVKSLKFHMTRIIGETLLSYEALLTYVNQIEAILNSRPLTPLSSDPNDLSVLTPAHFLIGDTLITVPDHNWSEIPTGRLSSWQHVQKMRQHFWRRWSKEYLHELTTRKKWHTRKPEQIEIGSIVTVRDDNLPAMRWTLARVTQLHPGEDDIVRVVTIRTASGEYKRSIKCLAPLPIYVKTSQGLQLNIIVQGGRHVADRNNEERRVPKRPYGGLGRAIYNPTPDAETLRTGTELYNLQLFRATETLQ
ncbi:uncharacterized protein LOC143363371 [Halictus rubicundus]|uniref:uncharacterized protein LOC143363371 n=1 Tax=Halictus rubicundus TaxID=77578 RepID=UPI004035D573